MDKTRWPSSGNLNNVVCNTLMGLGFNNVDVSQAMQDSEYMEAGLAAPIKIIPVRIFQNMDENENSDEGDGGNAPYMSIDEYQVIFIVPPDFGTTRNLAKTVTDSLLAMQQYLKRRKDHYSAYMDRWSSKGNPSRIYVANSTDHMLSLREQVDIVRIPVVTLPTQSGGGSSSESSDNSINVICVFGPTSKLNRLARSLKLFQ